ncbi:MAG: cytochrome c3 family protein [Chloroflexota bacterium]|nr:cytochrome c3 family protein [Chloroflexota bacterium]
MKLIRLSGLPRLPLAVVIMAIIIIGVVPTQVYAFGGQDCDSCHVDIGTSAKMIIDSQDIQDKLDDSVHRHVSCNDCHGQFEAGAERGNLSISQNCGTCHSSQYQLYANSIHGQSVVEEDKPDHPSCIDCHSSSDDANPHDILAVLDDDSSAYRKNVPDTCGSCHADENMMAPYDLDTYVVLGYERDFHGRAVLFDGAEIKDKMPATCVDCHESHYVQSSDSPASPVYKDNQVSTCRRCHEDASESIIRGWMGHSEPTGTHFPVVYYLSWVYRIMVPSVLLWGSTHVVLHLARSLRNRSKK